MTSKNDVEQTFQSATRDVQGKPVRWHRVERRARRLRLVALLGFVTAVVALTIIIATGIVAGKKATDPSYNPPLFSRATTDVDFGEGRTRRGHTRLGEYLRGAGLPRSGLTNAALREEGFVFSGLLSLKGYRNKPLELSWALRAANSGRRLAVDTYPNPTAIRPASKDVTANVQAWISYPRETGRYNVDLTLRRPNGTIESRSQSEDFTVFAPRVATAYRTPGYEALLPVGWRFVTKYEKAAEPRRYVTEMVGPRGLSIQIDTTLNYSGDPARSAEYLEGLHRQNTPGYHRVGLDRVVLGGKPVVQWSYEIDSVRKTDILFLRGPHGYGVLAQGPKRWAREIRAVARLVARSIKPVE
jgi:hypothetical protein